MAEYIVRVQQNGNPTEEDNKKLHEAMEKAGFVRTRKWGDKTYELPHAMYTGKSEKTAKDLTDELRPIIIGVWKSSFILTVKAQDISGFLSEVKPEKKN